MTMNFHIIKYCLLEHVDLVSNKCFLSFYDDLECS